MDNKEKQRLRLLYIIKILMERTDDEHGLSINHLSDVLLSLDIHANRETLYNDIRLLRDYGIDIIMDNAGRDRLYHIGERDFELAELKLLVDSVQASKFITEKKSKTLIDKLESFTSVYDAGKLERQVYVAGRNKTENENIYYNVDNIHAAIGKNSGIHFQYFQWSVDKKKELRHDGKIYNVSPWALTWDNEYYYMVGFDEDICEIRHYRVDKMINIELTDLPRVGSDEFDNFNLATYTNRLFGMFDGEERQVTLKVRNDYAFIIIDRFGIDIEINKLNSEWCQVTVNVAISEQFLGWIISLGDKVIIVDPKDVVDRMRAIGERIGRMYG